jgi:hypothetical protein
MNKLLKAEQPEFLPDAWERFEKAVSTVAKSGPKHRPAKPEKANRKGVETDAREKETPRRT